MSALADALRAAQAQTLAAMQRAYLAAPCDRIDFVEQLDAIGCTEKVEQEYLLATLEALRGFGVQGSTQTLAPSRNGDTEAATDAQWKLLRRLADERGRVAPDGPLTKDEASKAINDLKAGS